MQDFVHQQYQRRCEELSGIKITGCFNSEKYAFARRPVATTALYASSTPKRVV